MDISLNTVQLEHIPQGFVVVARLFRDVTNAADLHAQLLARNQDFEYAFIDASAVVSPIQAFSAVFRAINSLCSSSLRTPNVHSETVVSLSPSNNIAEAYRRFGLRPETRHLVVIKICPPRDDTQVSSTELAKSINDHLDANVKGTSCALTEENISACTDWDKVRKLYKLNGIQWLKNMTDEPRKKAQTLNLVLGAMALRGI